MSHEKVIYYKSNYNSKNDENGTAGTFSIILS